MQCARKKIIMTIILKTWERNKSFKINTVQTINSGTKMRRNNNYSNNYARSRKSQKRSFFLSIF